MAQQTSATKDRPSSVQEGECGKPTRLRPSGPTRDAVVLREFPEGMGGEMLVHAQDMANEVMHHAPLAASDVAAHAQDIADEVLVHSPIAAQDVWRETPILFGHLMDTLGEMFWPGKNDSDDDKTSSQD